MPTVGFSDTMQSGEIEGVSHENGAQTVSAPKPLSRHGHDQPYSSWPFDNPPSTGEAHGRPRRRLAGSALCRLARDSRNIAALDPDRGQGPAGADALAEPWLAGPTLRDRARAWHVADPGGRRNPRDRVRPH